jgi:hypothetical protein
MLTIASAKAYSQSKKNREKASLSPGFSISQKDIARHPISMVFLYTHLRFYFWFPSQMSLTPHGKRLTPTESG